ncbi:hypothetical protein JCM10908_000089 [Rhodotorula pacifica]|uniref:uncharacterized protein n=1 Tax=Rhodotorula pacifica TaxID=1495444 RepID=UPI00317CE562
MSIAATTEKPTTPSSSEKVAPEHETALHRVTDYPLVKDTLTTAHGFVEQRPYLNNLFERTLSLSLSILHRLEPLQKRLPLQLADGYANSALDVVEKYVPQVKLPTGEILGLAKQPADKAYGRANELKSGLQQRISPVTEQVYQRINQSQSQLAALQERLKKQIPHDQESLKHTLDSILAELDSLVKSAQSIPSHAQQAAKPYLDGVFEASEHIKKEITRNDIPLGTKASNVLAYSQEKLGPVLEQIQNFLLKKRDESAVAAEEVKDKAGEKSEEVKSKAQAA